ncbi:Aste57867_4776 [Aphanomyces stellatus]|uniref:Aste57867_4776 protein n=1 Tax=Aphanomyces stellatus TaxID=120398 RepID=A0A485KGD5_9STRA|nr:hypothetical protein As57867_004763 [Aphanomyces stellatus]VFT81871.1 Aste57867_4776 [Aphanomyces stellatus]
MADIRRASHAGSWYSNRESELSTQLGGWLSEASSSAAISPNKHVRALIAPHAGYAYSGPTAAHAYQHINPSLVDRIFLLGPSHHVYMTGCALTSVSAYETPLGSIEIDKQVNNALFQTGLFDTMDITVDTNEHSLELHLPYIAKVMGSKPYTLVPILVGELSAQAGQQYGQLLAEHMKNPRNLFIVSSDFCHWGARFRYQPYESTKGAIHEFIQQLDHQGIEHIEHQDIRAFDAYLKETRNTICGRHPISLLLYVLAHVPGCTVQFVKYAQSSACLRPTDSSVSYASAIVYHDSA